MVKAFHSVYVVPNYLVCFLLEGKELINRVPFVSSTSEVDWKIFDDERKVRNDIFV